MLAPTRSRPTPRRPIYSACVADSTPPEGRVTTIKHSKRYQITTYCQGICSSDSWSRRRIFNVGRVLILKEEGEEEEEEEEEEDGAEEAEEEKEEDNREEEEEIQRRSSAVFSIAPCQKVPRVCPAQIPHLPGPDDGPLDPIRRCTHAHCQRHRHHQRS